MKFIEKGPKLLFLVSPRNHKSCPFQGKGLKRAASRCIVAVLLLLFSSCGDHRLGWHYNEFQSLPENGWYRRDTLTFLTDTIDTTRMYELSVHVRTLHATPYPYSNLTLSIRQEWQPDSMIHTDTIECDMNRLRNDERVSEGALSFIHGFPIDTLQLRKGMSGKISITHRMYRTPLIGISEIGFTLKGVSIN